MTPSPQTEASLFLFCPAAECNDRMRREMVTRVEPRGLSLSVYTVYTVYSELQFHALESGTAWSEKHYQ